MSTDHHYHAGPIVLSPSPMGALSFPSPYTRTRRRRVSSSARTSSARSAAPTAWTLPKSFARTGIGTPSYLVPPLWVFYGSTAHATQHPPPHNSSSGVVRPPHSRPCTYPAGSILWLLASSPFSVFPIDPKPIILHRTIAASNRRLQQKRHEIRGPPPDSRRPHLPNWHIPNLHTRPTDHPLPQPTPSHTDQLPGRRLEVPETRDGVPIFKPVHRRTRFSRTTHKASGIEIGGRCRSVDCLMEGRHYRSLRMTREEEEEDRLTGWWRTAGLCCVRNNLQVIQLFTILLGYFVKTGLFVWAWLLMVLWPAPWLVLLFEVSTTPAKVLLGLFICLTTSLAIWLEWLEDRDKYFADDCVHRFKLRPSSLDTYLPYHSPFPRGGPVILLLCRPIGQPRSHIRCSVSGLDSVFTGSSRVKSLLSEKLGSPSAPSLSASPYGMFLSRGCIGSLVFDRAYHQRVLLIFTSTMWLFWSSRWFCFKFSLICSHARSLPATATSPLLLDLTPTAAHTCRAEYLSADIPIMVYLQFCHLSCVTTARRDVIVFLLHELHDICALVILYFKFLIPTRRLLSKLFREVGYPHPSRRTGMPFLVLCNSCVYSLSV